MTRAALPAALLLLLGCGSSLNAGGGTHLDRDGDGFAPTTGDCRDDDASIHPGAVEVPYDGVDQDCDTADLVDADRDGHVAVEAGGADCDDGRAAIHPEASETCDDGLDQDCDGADAPCGTGGTGGGVDDDGDGFTEEDGDCDDTRADVHPGAEEVPNDGVDQDCSGGDWVDLDGDGYRANSVGGTDCDDGDAEVHPGAFDACDDGLDADCRDGDPACARPETDYDRDGHGSLASGGDDCDDTRADVNPSVREIPFDTVDQDCDGNDAAPPRDAFTIAADAVGRPWAAATATGFLVVWSATTGSDLVLRARPLDVAGEPAGPEVELDRVPDLLPEDRRLGDLRMVAGGPGALVNWMRGSWERCAVVVDAAGRPLSPVHVSTGSFFDGPTEAVAWTGDGWASAWMESGGLDPSLHLQTFSAAGEAGAPRQVGFGANPALAMAPDGGLLLAFASPAAVEVTRVVGEDLVPVHSGSAGWLPVLTPGLLAYATEASIEVVDLATGDGTAVPANELDFLVLEDDSPRAVLAWSGLTPESYDNPNRPRGRAFHLTVFAPGASPRTLDLWAEAHEPLLGGIAVRDGRALVVWKPGLERSIRGMVVRP